MLLIPALLLSGCQMRLGARPETQTQPPAAASGELNSQSHASPIPTQSKSWEYPAPQASAPAAAPLDAQALSATAAPADAVQPAAVQAAAQPAGLSYPLVDTGQGLCFNDSQATACPLNGAAFSGQDAQSLGSPPAYVDNGDGTVSDQVTGLTWQQDPGALQTYAQASAGAAALNLGGRTDWRLPTIKELYSLVLFDGSDPSSCKPGTTCSVTPMVDTRVFKFEYGGASAGGQGTGAPFWSGTSYVGKTASGSSAVFGVDFAGGQVKAYPTLQQQGEMQAYVRYVRGGSNYGANSFTANADGTVNDGATGLTWQQADSGGGMNWQQALAYCEAQTLAGQSDWRLPDARELQSIVDYLRAPAVTNSPAIDPLFSATAIQDESGKTNYPYYWTSTTHVAADGSGTAAVYLAFGEASGYQRGQPGMQGASAEAPSASDVDGAGAVRSDPKSGDPAAFSTQARQAPGAQGTPQPMGQGMGAGPQGTPPAQGAGPQGGPPSGTGAQGTPSPQGLGQAGAPGMGSGNGVVRILNYVRCVRGGKNASPDGIASLNRPAQTVEISAAQGPGGAAPGGGAQGTPSASGRMPGGMTPPQAAIDACASSQQGAACTFSDQMGSHSGTCSLDQQAQVLACMPAGGPGGGAGGGPPPGSP